VCDRPDGQLPERAKDASLDLRSVKQRQSIALIALWRLLRVRRPRVDRVSAAPSYFGVQDERRLKVAIIE